VCFVEDSSGNDSVFGFANGLDTFSFSLHSTVNDFGDLTIGTSGSDAIVTFSGGQITVFGAAGLIDSNDFTFA
jgi:hypothetical protein